MKNLLLTASYPEMFIKEKARYLSGFKVKITKLMKLVM